LSQLRRVLAIDDSKLIQRMYKLVFMKYKECELVEAPNGLEALEILARNNDFDLIVLDINMPVMNGIEFMEKIREKNMHRHIPIVVISTEGKEEDTVRAMKLGAWGYIQKPFRSEELYTLIDKILAKKPPVLKTGRYW
jgi:two-component system chemotaxis response regulator CheY